MHCGSFAWATLAEGRSSAMTGSAEDSGAEPEGEISEKVDDPSEAGESSVANAAGTLIGAPASRHAHTAAAAALNQW